MNQSLSTHGIGASEIAAVCGMSPYASPWDVYLRKTGQVPDIEPGAPIEWGHRLEPAIRQAYADKTGRPMYVPAESLFHPDYPWARATPDAITIQHDTWDWLVQVKNVGYWVGKDWEESPPVYVQLQEQWEMYVTGLERADVAALIAGSDFRIYTVHRDAKIIGDLADIAAAFWRKVEARTPPAIDESAACRDHFSRRLAKVGVVELQADSDLERTMSRWHGAREDFKRAEAAIKQTRNLILAALDGAQADRIVSTIGTAKLARHVASTHRETDWRLVAELVASAGRPLSRDDYASIVEANTVSVETPAHVTLREPRGWSKDNK